MALRFFERIGKMYRKERWDPISDRIRALWLDCAKREGKPEEVIRLLVDEIGAGQASQNDLIDYLTVRDPLFSGLSSKLIHLRPHRKPSRPRTRKAPSCY